MSLSRDEIQKRLDDIVRSGGGEAMCLHCSPSPNALAEIIDLLEDLGITVETFVEKVNQRYRRKVLGIERGRLRILALDQCMDVGLLGKNFIFSLAGLGDD